MVELRQGLAFILTCWSGLEIQMGATLFPCLFGLLGINPEDLQNLAAKGNINSRILVWRHFFAIFNLNYLVWSCPNAVLITPSRPSFRHGLRPLWWRYHFSWRPNPISVSTWANDPCTCLTSSHCIHLWTSLDVVEHRWTCWTSLNYIYWLSRQETPHSVARNMKRRCQVRSCKFPLWRTL